MSALRRKLRRDLRRAKWQFSAVTVMVILGVTFFVGLYGSMANLRSSIDRTYADLHFADVTVSFQAAPADIVRAIGEALGVDRIEGRLNLEVPTTFAGGNGDVIAGRILSLPAPSRPAVNDILVTDGAYFSNASAKEFIAEKAFAVHHGLRVGDTVRIETPIGPQEGRIVGIAVSPEYLWPARSAPEHMPEVLRRWGVLFAPYEAIAPLFGLGGSVNEVAFTVRAGADGEAVGREIQTLLEPYGVYAIVPRAQQPSQAILDTMVGALDSLSLVFPLFFLVIVALSTYALLSRLVHAQRGQIGVLLALGFSRRDVLVHYLSFALLVALIGSLAGIALGYALAFPVTDLFAGQVSLPLIYKEPRWDVMAAGVALSVAFAATAGILPAYRASRERPADTMRGEAPRSPARTASHREARRSAVRVVRRLPLRQLKRNPVRSAFTVVALALAGSLIIVPFGFLDAMDAAIATQTRTMNYDLVARLYRPMPMNASEPIGSWPGIAAVEPFVAAPLVLQAGEATFNVVLYGIRAESEAIRLFSRAGDRVFPSEGGILLSVIYEKRGLRAGDTVTVGPIEGRINGFVNDLSSNGYLPIENFQAGLGMDGLFNGLYIRLESASSEETVRASLYASLPVWAVASTAKSIQDTNDMLRLYYAFIGLIVAFGMALAAAIVFNAVTINVLERNREIATMRTIGMKGGAIARMITTENLLVLTLSVIFGSILGTALTAYFVTLFGGDVFVLDAKITWQTFALSAALLLGVLLVSEVPSLRHVQRLDLAKVTKERAG